MIQAFHVAVRALIALWISAAGFVVLVWIRATWDERRSTIDREWERFHAAARRMHGRRR